MIVVSVLFFLFRRVAASILSSALEGVFPGERVSKFVSVFVIVFAVFFFVLAVLGFLGGLRTVLS
jgi:hypothetical protein